jgi:ElaB/YqjD/DUF883 family membrane-anchored ribosome-binding protein
MAQDPMTKAAADYEAVVAQMTALRGDLAKLAQDVQKAATNGGHAMAGDISAGVTEASNYITRKGRDADLRIEGAVAANPYVSLALAAGMGVLIGALTRR